MLRLPTLVGYPPRAIHHWLLTGHLLQAWGPPPRQPQLVFCLLQLAGLEFLNLERGTKRAEEKNFSLDESTQLARSWINVSEDPKVGAYQTGATFWTRVFQHYHQNRLSHWPERYASLTILHLRLATKHCFSLSAAPPLLSKISSRQCPLRCPNLSLPLNKLRTM